ncbi:two-component system, OmpR family, KDP operon response regulator KdpE [Prosthecobacter debontii]|uniref:Two-component system, OmpR family, KDP operon response regulator KdpE n=1 Tax=Prosthecobacter debontii TaxID=48467 RepID=A0A1T4WFH4_9BACT|nr:response regulator transcription factor [Prosthecobacter debontii]SKA76072.1 two-component system, OmpR family, KDP operon response regulator KdpE [Prosthecobacter debontii]
MTALVIDDEVQIRRLLRLALETKGYAVREAESGLLGLQEAVFHKPEVILLDLGLPDMDGVEVLKRLREWSSIPVLILSVRDYEQAKLAAFDAGADDYVTKPFSTAELLARLAAIQRRHVGDESANLEVGPLSLDPARHEARLNGASLKLTPTEYAMLAQLVRHAGKVVTLKQLLRAVWGPQAEQQNHYLRVYANHLRKKLEGTGLEIQNEPGIGYRLITGDR